MTHDFVSSSKIGAIGESIIYEYLCDMPNVQEVIDVRKDKHYQEVDIDYILIMQDGHERTVEVKTDSYVSPNLFFETMSSLESNSIGCMYKTQATWLLYYFLTTKELYVLKMPDFRDWVDENIKRFEKKRIKNWRYDRVRKYTTEGRLIPKVILEEEFTSFKKIML